MGKANYDDYELIRVLGKGTYGKVLLVRYKTTGALYAMKCLSKALVVSKNQVEHTKTERNVLCSVSHPFIVDLVSAFQTPKKLYFVLEYCPGGELFFHLSRAGRFSESVARFYSAEIVLALEYLHSRNIIYRDLKPENVLLDAAGHVKLTDFGLSKEQITTYDAAKSLCGTPEYLAPEILERRGHGKAVDWYSLGTLVYEMLTGLPPFYSKDRERLFDRIRYGNLAMPKTLSAEASDLLQSLLSRDPARRLGGGPADGAAVKAHAFFRSVNWRAVFDRRYIPPFVPRLDSETDVRYFEREFLEMPLRESVDDTATEKAREAEKMRDSEKSRDAEKVREAKGEQGREGAGNRPLLVACTKSAGVHELRGSGGSGSPESSPTIGYLDSTASTSPSTERDRSHEFPRDGDKACHKGGVSSEPSCAGALKCCPSIDPKLKPIGPSLKPIGPNMKPIGPNLKPTDPSFRPTEHGLNPMHRLVDIPGVTDQLADVSFEYEDSVDWPSPQLDLASPVIMDLGSHGQDYGQDNQAYSHEDRDHLHHDDHDHHFHEHHVDEFEGFTYHEDEGQGCFGGSSSRPGRSSALFIDG